MGQLCTAFLFVLILPVFAFSAEITPFSTLEQKRRVFSLTAEDYEDIRVDSNFDKKIDFWRIKKGLLTIDTYFGPSQTIFHIRKFDGAQVEERVVVRNREQFFLALSRSRKKFSYNYSKASEICLGSHKDKWADLLKSMSSLSQADLTKAAEQSMAEECFEIAGGGLGDALQAAIKEIHSPPSEKWGNNEILSCLESPSVRSLFSQTFGPENGPIKYESMLIMFKNRIVEFPKTDKKTQIICQQTEESNPRPPMKVDEQGVIQVRAAKPPAKIDKSEVKRQLFHEILHSVALEQEALVEAVTESCIEGKDPDLSQLLAKDPKNARTPPPMPADVDRAAREASASHAQAIPAGVAEAPQIPTPDFSPLEMNRFASASTEESTLQFSTSHTGGVVRMAERILASTPAVAAPTSGKISMTNSGIPSGSVSFSRKGIAATGVNKVAEPVASESVATGVVQGNIRASTANEEAASSEVSSRAPASTSTELYRPAGAEPSSPIASSLPKGPRSPAGGGISREEVVSFIARGSYQQARAKLTDSEFISALRRNNITIFDLSGNVLGAIKGDIIFVDQGDRFVRKK